MISPPNQKAPVVPRLGSAASQERVSGTPTGGRRDPATPSRVVRTSRTPPSSTQLMQLPAQEATAPHSARGDDDDDEYVGARGQQQQQQQQPPAGSSANDANALPLRVDSTEDIAEDVALASILSRRKSESYDEDGFEELSTSPEPEEEALAASSDAATGAAAASAGNGGGARKSPTPLSSSNLSTSERRPSLNPNNAGAGGGGAAASKVPRFNADNVQKKERVGRGTFGDVFRGVDTSNGTEVAIKEIVVAQDAGKDLEKQIHTLEREIRVMQKLDHPNTVKYFGARRHLDALHIYMEYVRGGTLASLLRAKGPLSEEHARKFTTQLVQGLLYLHGRNIIHRDLKGDNLFVDDLGNLKVGDFGTSKELATVKITNSVAGTPNFMAPEVVTCAGHSLAADVWSVGCCVVQMLSGKAPFANVDNHMAVMFAVMKGSIREQIPANITPLARSFIVACVKQKPEERLTCEELLKHPWLMDGGGDGGAASAEPPKPTTPPPPPTAVDKASTPPTPPSGQRKQQSPPPEVAGPKPSPRGGSGQKPATPPMAKGGVVPGKSPPPHPSSSETAVRPVISMKGPPTSQPHSKGQQPAPKRTSSDLGKKSAAEKK